MNEFTPSNILKRLTDPRHYFLVSENEEGIDGFIQVSTDSPAPVSGCSTTEISTFYVQPRHHGKGIGKKLLNAALLYCNAQSAKSVWLATNAENAPAIAFYLAQGFIKVGETHFRIGEEAYLNNVYTLSLA